MKALILALGFGLFLSCSSDRSAETRLPPGEPPTNDGNPVLPAVTPEPEKQIKTPMKLEPGS